MRKNIIANFIAKFWSMSSSFLFIPLYIYYLGFDSYSLISFTLVIAGMMVILDGGLSATLSREFARSDKPHFEKIRIYKTLEPIYLMILIFCVFLIFFSADFLSTGWLNSDVIQSDVIETCIKIFGFDIAFQLISRFYNGGLLGLEKQVRANVIQVAWSMLRNGLVILVVINTESLEIFFIWQAISTILYAIILKASLEKLLYKKPSFSISIAFEKNVIKDIWRFAFGMMLISIVAAINTQMDKLAISNLLPLTEVGYYTLAFSLASLILAVSTPFSIAILPRFTALFSQNNISEVIVLLKKIGSLLGIIIFSIYANIFFFGQQLLYLWTANYELALYTYKLLQVIAFSVSMLAVATIPFSVAIANGYTKLNNIIGILSLVITLPGYWFATKYFGSIGAAYVYTIVQTLTTFIYYYFINKKYLKLRIFRIIFLDQIFRPLCISLIFVFSVQLLPIDIPTDRLLLAFYLFISLLLTLTVNFLIDYLFVNKDKRTLH